ncbi:MAG: rhomboid family intramembrane serine protease [Gemmatimonadota bacterium]
MTPWVKRLLIANVVMFLLTRLDPALSQALMLYPPWVLYRPWTVVTYMFLHAGIMHITFNMLVLFFFGPRLEERLGGKLFLWLYFLSGIGGALGSFLFARQYPVIGASAAVYGVLIGFTMYWPRERIYLYFLIPVEAWILAIVLVGFTLWAGMSNTQSNTAHFAHLGGIVVGFVFLKIVEWRRGAPRRAFQQAMAPRQSTAKAPDRVAVARWKGISTEGLHEINREEVERLLIKVGERGTGSLTAAEREFLDRMAAR